MKDLQDVVIIGGGPAGSTAATLLAKKGCQVTVLEKEKFPRDHVGESLLPFCYNILNKLGVLDSLTKSFVRKPGVRFIDSTGKGNTTWCFNHVIKDPSWLSFQVDRSKFDQILLNNAALNGATVREQTRVQRVDLEGYGRMVSVKAIGPRGGKQTYHAKFILDASGRSAFMANRMGERKKFEGLDRTALWSHWTGMRMRSGLEEGISLIVYLGGDKKGWIWIFPLGVDRLTVGVVLNNDYIRSQKTKHERIGVKNWQLELYNQELMSSPFARDLLAVARLAKPLIIEGDYSYYIERKYGSNFAIVGDASTFIDPIFSSGVFLAMKGSSLVAEAIYNKLFSHDGSGIEPLEQAYNKINGAYRLVYKLIRTFYNPHAISFARAGDISRGEHLKHENAMAAGHFILAGDFFEQHEKYEEFFDLLQDPKNFRRYKKYVIDRKDFQSDSCGVSESEIFGAMLAGDEEKQHKSAARN